MNPIWWAEWCQIEVTNFCWMDCLYCSRYSRHLRQDQKYHMTLDFLETALDTLTNWPGRIGIIGGEPTLHPQFVEMCRLIQGKFPRERMGLWTSGSKRWPEYQALARETFGLILFNEHNESQKAVCKHQPLTLAIKEVVPDPVLRRQLIDDCWVPRDWCPSISPKGAFFCEVACAMDRLLDGPGGFPVEPDWWKRTPEQFEEQVCRYCDHCGMAIPIERELIRKTQEKFSPGNLALFREHRLRKVAEEDVELFTGRFGTDEARSNREAWNPANYRGDVFGDKEAPVYRVTKRYRPGETAIPPVPVHVVTMWRNEELLAPFFFEHYRYADKIHLLLDADSTDRTAQIAAQYANVSVQQFRTPPTTTMDPIKAGLLTAAYRSIGEGWVYVVAADEFLFPLPLEENPREFLSRQTQGDLMLAQLWPVYRHRSEADLNPARPPLLQRRHGDAAACAGPSSGSCRAIVARAGMDLGWLPGGRPLAGSKPVRPLYHVMYGVCWAMADAAIATGRHAADLPQLPGGGQAVTATLTMPAASTRAQILDVCRRHADDPQLF